MQSEDFKKVDVYYGDEEGQYCANLEWFYEAEIESQSSFGVGWFEGYYAAVSRCQQVLFVLFVIIGFAMCIANIGFRADIWLKEEWSSYRKIEKN